MFHTMKQNIKIYKKPTYKYLKNWDAAQFLVNFELQPPNKADLGRKVNLNHTDI